MMQYEFEALAGYEVSTEDYNNIIEPMYMAVNLDKAEFVKVIDKKRFALKTEKQILNRMKKLAKHLAETCDHYTDWDAEHEFEALRREYRSRFWGNGHVEVNKGYTIPELMRGCTYPQELVCYTAEWNKVTTITLVK